MEKSLWHHWESKQRPSGLYRNASTKWATACPTFLYCRVGLNNYRYTYSLFCVLYTSVGVQRRSMCMLLCPCLVMTYISRLQASAAVHTKPSLLWIVTQRKLVTVYGRCGTANWSHLQGPLNMVPRISLAMSINIHKHKPPNNPEERRTNLHFLQLKL